MINISGALSVCEYKDFCASNKWTKGKHGESHREREGRREENIKVIKYLFLIKSMY